MAKKTLNFSNNKVSVTDSIHLCSTEEISSVLGMTPQWVRKLSKEGVIPQVTRGKFDLLSTVKRYIGYLKESQKEQSTPSDQKKMKARKLKAETEEREARAKLAEIQLDEKAGKLISREDVIREWSGRCVEVKAALLGLPQEIGFLFPDSEYRHMIEERVEQFVYETLERYSREGISTPAPASLMEPPGAPVATPPKTDNSK